MLDEIRIKSLGVIDEAHIEFGAGFTALTGETGAGKTMVLTALGLVLGQRADASLVRQGASRLATAATFRLPDEARARSLVEDQGGEVDGNSVVLARMVGEDGKSRALVGGASSTAGMLNQIGEELISIHAQLSSTRLLKSSRQRELVDRFGDLSQEYEAYQTSYGALKDAEDALARYLADQADAERLSSDLQVLVDRVGEVRPQSEEYSQLTQKMNRLAHLDELLRAISGANEILQSDESPSIQIANLHRSLDSAKGRDGHLDALIEEVADISSSLSELSLEIARFSATFDDDEERLDAVNARLAKVQSLLRRFDEPFSDEGIRSLLIRCEEAEKRLADLALGQSRIADLQAQVSSALSSTKIAASTLSKARVGAANQLAERITSEIRSLAMPRSEFKIEVSQRPNFDSHGADNVEFLLSAGSGAPFVPVAKGASGGELSRVMLALEVVLASIDPVPTYIFDEVDAGVGGEAALEVGKRLARLSRHAQVIVVTHLAQVAAFADHHVVVSKSSNGSVTESQVRSVTADERESELARMMAGIAQSTSAQASAAELLTLAAREKQ